MTAADLAAITLQPGLHPNVPAERYHNDACQQPSLSASIAKILCSQSPAHARAVHPRLNPDYQRKVEDKFDVGTSVHSLFLEGQQAVCVVEAADWRTKDAKEQRDLARAHGMIPMLAHQWDRVVEMEKALRSQLEALTFAMFAGGQPEQTIVWEEDGVLCRSRLDYLLDDHTAVHDLKSTDASADPDKWIRTMYGFGGDIQVAFHLRGVKAVTGADAEFVFCVIETSPPFAMSLVALAPSALAIANAKVDYAIDLWRKCLAENEWPAYDQRIAYADVPPWEEVRWLAREARAA